MNPEDSFVSRYVGWLLLPFATALAGLVAVAAKNWLNVDLDTTEITAWIVSVATGFTVWLYNRGRYEVAKATGLDVETVDKIVQKVIEEKLPSTEAGTSGRIAAGEIPDRPLSNPGGTSAGQ